jgi:pimeloyl-ACP methyl ester carboxylesterase
MNPPREGHFFVGGEYFEAGGGVFMANQMYVEFRLPAERRHELPIVMIHGGGQTGTNFTATPDGREGWAQYFVHQGYAVYVVDQVGRGRSAHHAEPHGGTHRSDAARIEGRFTAPERSQLWPQARLHTQWPGEGVRGQPAFDQFFASQVAGITDRHKVQSLNQRAGAALLDRIGPAILLTHSQSGAIGWLIGDARPELVKAIVAVEPGGGAPYREINFTGAPTWFEEGPVTAPWGVTSIRITYSPPVSDPSELRFVRQEPLGPELACYWLQEEPARKLANLASIPVLVVTGEASYHATTDRGLCAFLEQAGVPVTHLPLGEAGIHGNGHMMMLERNSDDIAATIAGWLATLPG